MADNKKFIPFSIATSQFKAFGKGDTSHIDPELLPEPEPDYKEEFYNLSDEIAKLRKESFDSKRKMRDLKTDLKKQTENFDSLQAGMEAAIKNWKNEIKSHCGSAIINSLSQIMQMPDVLDLALSNRISKAVQELSEKKSIRVHVSPKQKKFADEKLEHLTQWEVISDESIDAGALFKTEQGKWETTVQIAIDETIAIIQAWIQDK